MIQEGDKAPDFTAIDQDGNTHSLEDYKGKFVVLYFYPKDMTPGCTREACDFRDNIARVKDLGAVVLGVSPDSAEKHAKFVDKESLNFPLLADEEKKILEAYGAWGEKKMYGKTFLGVKRSTFLIGPDGTIAKAWPNVKVKGHVDKVLDTIAEMAEA
jgi:peroxiredoxin Q/BCP